MTETIKLGAGKKKALEKAVSCLKKGGIIIFPTETSYGIGADALNENAIDKVHSAKKHPHDKAVSVIVSDLKQAEKVAEINKETKALAKKFFPGPLTIIAREKNVPSSLARNGMAFRIPDNKFAVALCKAFGNPITATSANIHGEPAIYNPKELIEKFNGRVDLIIDAGILPKREASTIYCTINHKILREGKIKKEEIEEALKK